ncbi:MAG TPA: YdjY domain-containing protein [Pirellulales bacterium]|nr:YdjY domain-containing protein [Pirellulales bacterium]
MQVRKLGNVATWVLSVCGAIILFASQLWAEEPKNPADPTATLKRLMPNYDVWIDFKNRQVVMQGEICLTRGPLEMFAVTKGTKEHESVVAVNTKAFVVHAALLEVGAVPGTTVKYEPKFAPPAGTPVDIWAYWTDDKGDQHKDRAQDWVRDVKTKKAMEQGWVFAGSGFYTDEATKKQYYMAEAGDFICVSNFPDAMLDVPIESTSDNDDLLFEAFTENIPPKGTKVLLVLMPRIENKGADKKSDGADKVLNGAGAAHGADNAPSK